MNLTRVLLVLLLLYKWMTKNGPDKVLELKFVPSPDYKPPKDSKSFNLVNLVQKLENKNDDMQMTQKKELLSKYFENLSVDKPDLIVSYTWNNMILLIFTEEISRDVTKLHIQSLQVGFFQYSEEPNLRLSLCNSLMVQGKITELDSQGGHLLITTKRWNQDQQLEDEVLFFINEADCSLKEIKGKTPFEAKKRFETVFELNYTALLGPNRRLKHPVVLKYWLIGLDNNGQLVSINIWDKKVSLIELDIEGCKGVSKLGSFGSNLILVCYQPKGVKIETTIVVAKFLNGPGETLQMKDGKVELIEIKRHKLVSDGHWRNLQDYLGYVDLIQISMSPRKDTAVVTLKNEVIWLHQERRGKERVFMGIKSLPVNFTDKAIVSSPKDAYFISSFSGRETMITSQTNDLTREGGFSQQVVKLPRRFYKHFAVDHNQQAKDSMYVIIDENGLYLYLQVNRPAHHKSVGLLWEGFCSIGTAYWYSFLITIFLRVLLGLLYKVRVLFLSYRIEELKVEEIADKIEKKFFSDIKDRLDHLCSRSKFGLLKDTIKVSDAPQETIKEDSPNPKDPDPITEKAESEKPEEFCAVEKNEAEITN